MNSYLRLGPARFAILPMSYQKLQTETELHVATIGRFGNIDAKQVTGFAQPTIQIEGLMFPKEFGGRSDYESIRAVQASGRAVMMVGLAASAGRNFGRVVITTVSDTQSEIDVDGLGKMVEFSVTVEGTDAFSGAPGGLF